MKIARLAVGLLLVFLALTGCGKTVVKAPPEGSSPAPVQLPAWAPENPTEGFLRAARVLKPIPTEAITGGVEQGKATGLQMSRFISTWPAAYEFFGSLSDDEIERFLTVKEIRKPVKSLPSEQRAALDNWFETWRTAMAGAAESEDFLTDLYKLGAAEDLSNVDVGFVVPGYDMVHIKFWVKQPDGNEVTSVAEFAQL